jgi:hypothetical protein
VTFQETLKQNMSKALEKGRSLTDSSVDAISDTVYALMRENAEQGEGFHEIICDVTQEAIQDSRAMGLSLGQSAKGAVLGAVHEAEREGEDLADTIREAGRQILRKAYGVGGNLSDAARGFFEGAYEAAQEMAVTRARATHAALLGAFEAGDDLGGDAQRRIRASFDQLPPEIRRYYLDDLKEITRRQA